MNDAYDFWDHRFFQAEEYEWQPTLFQPVHGMDRIWKGFLKKIGRLVRYDREVIGVHAGRGCPLRASRARRHHSADAQSEARRRPEGRNARAPQGARRPAPYARTAVGVRCPRLRGSAASAASSGKRRELHQRRELRKTRQYTSALTETTKTPVAICRPRVIVTG